MNRKNLTAAVLAGLAGIAGIAGTAQAVNLNPDGLGQVLIYPYYTTNGGNQTVLSVVNTTESAKAVKVRFLEGYNSREVLDFNLYMSAFDVWVAAIYDDAGTPTLVVPDDSCTVPYIHEFTDSEQPFLSLAYNDNVSFDNDGGPTGIDRAAEGHIEMIEMGTVEEDSDTEDHITHQTHEVLDDDDVHDGHEEHDHHVVVDTFWAPGDCHQLVDNWTINHATHDGISADDGIWIDDATEDIGRNSGGLFGGAAIVNADNGTMYSYNALAIQGYDKSDGERHAVPGTTSPGLNSGDQHDAWVFFGVPQNRAVELDYHRGVDAISAVFMHENIMNEYTLSAALSASTEWVITFPTKNFYVDEGLIASSSEDDRWVPDNADPQCNDWVDGEDFPDPNRHDGDEEHEVGPDHVSGEPDPNPITEAGWEGCTYINVGGDAIFQTSPFTELFDGEACEVVSLKTWDRDERTAGPDAPSGEIPPVVSPSIPCDPGVEVCEEEETKFELCYEVNVLRFGDGVIFGTPDLGGSSLLIEVDPGFENGWARIDMYSDTDHEDHAGLAGLPVTGFAAFEFENNFVTGSDGVQDVKAFYGGLFTHRGNVRQVDSHSHD